MPLVVKLWRAVQAAVAKIAHWLPRGPARSRRQLAVALTWRFLTLLATAVLAAHLTSPVRSVPSPRKIPAGGAAGSRFGLSESQRRSIFAQLATKEPTALRIARARFRGQPWSIEDDRARVEKDTVRSVSRQHGLNLSQVYLVLDEGIRSGWPAPSGDRLPATTPPLDRRRQ